MSSPMVVFDGIPHAVLRETDDWGVRVLDLAAPPRRLRGTQSGMTAPVRTHIDPYQTQTNPLPGQLLTAALADGDTWSAMSKRSLARFAAFFLTTEDPQRRLDNREVVTLAHQVSLVRHILDTPGRHRVLIGDEVGLGKTVVAGLLIQELLAANPGLRVLYLAPARLVSNVGREFKRLSLFFREWKSTDGDARLETDSRIIASIHRAVHPNHFDRLRKLRAWQLDTWEAYRDVPRLGRKTRLREPQRAVLWSIFERVRAGLRTRTLLTSAGLFTGLASAISQLKHPPFDFAVVDEAQDLGIPHLRFFAALGANRPNSLFFAGDLGQRIFQQPFSWKALGVDIRGRSRTLRVNYRTSHQIRTQADRLLGPEMTDVDGNVEDRSHTVSAFNGPPPTIQSLTSEDDEIRAVGKWLSELAQAGLLPHELAIFVRSPAQLDRAKAAAGESGMAFKVLDEHVETASGHVSISTMHLAKGLEFRAVAVMACDDEIIPLQERIETVGDDADLEEVYNTERHLLYVACTRARDHLLVTSVEPASEFLDDLRI